SFTSRENISIGTSLRLLISTNHSLTTAHVDPDSDPSLIAKLRLPYASFGSRFSISCHLGDRSALRLARGSRSKRITTIVDVLLRFNGIMAHLTILRKKEYPQTWILLQPTNMPFGISLCG